MTMHDLVIRGGTVIDPASGLHERRDVGIADGRIAAVAVPGDTTATATGDTFDATGLLVVPGLIDLHVHVYPGVADLSVEADASCLGRGVTTVVDAGSAGANTFSGFRRLAVEPSRTRVLALLNISAMGQIDTHFGDLHDLRFVDPERAIAVADANRDVVVGFKVRVSEHLSGPNGLIGLDRAVEAARATGLRLMVHVGGTPFGIGEVLDRLQRGDVITHMYTGWRPGNLLADSVRVESAAREARARGIRFDVGHGAGSFSWPVAEAALADGFAPDSISTDLHRFNIAGPVHDLVTTMAKFLSLGLPLETVIAMATVAPAAALAMTGVLGTLAVGSVADVTVLRLEEGRFDLTDADGVVRQGSQRLVPVAVVRAGVLLPIQPPVSVPPGGVSPG